MFLVASGSETAEDKSLRYSMTIKQYFCFGKSLK